MKASLDLDVMRAAAKGLSIADIATLLHVSADEASCRFAAACRQVKAQGQTGLAMYTVDHCLSPEERKQWVIAAKSAAAGLPTLSNVEQRDLLICLVAPQLRDMPLAAAAPAIARSEEEIRTILRQWAARMGTPATRTAVAITHYLSQQERLFQEELDVVRLVTEGCTNKEIARKIYIPLKDVAKRRERAYASLRLHEPQELAMYYGLYVLPEAERQRVQQAAQASLQPVITNPNMHDHLRALDIASHPLHWGKPVAALAPLVAMTPVTFAKCLNQVRRRDSESFSRNTVELLWHYFLVRQFALG